ncbi:hypothetical protein T03_8217 [Trichinella britovi]|uniref:Uncharacterized protein n=1 Tax=Trichinella britovi TaxID=45882 RepID=A0A0V1AJW5_TRIBR|nr:hypothetical protein T03_8217 [Trichinella britovi]
MAFKALVILVAYCLCTSWQIVYIFIEFLMSFANLQIVLIGRIQQCISPVPIASRHLFSVRSFIAQKPVSSAALCK